MSEQYASLQKNNATKNEHKFWICEIETERFGSGDSTRYNVVTHFGRIGTAGQRRIVGTRNLKSTALDEAERRTRKKQMEGYQVVDAAEVVRQIDEKVALKEMDDIDALLANIDV